MTKWEWKKKTIRKIEKEKALLEYNNIIAHRKTIFTGGYDSENATINYDYSEGNIL